MSKKILFVNQASYKTSDDSNVLEHRKKWIVQGLQSLKLVERHFDKCDVIFMDNTVDDITELPEEIQQNMSTTPYRTKLSSIIQLSSQLFS